VKNPNSFITNSPNLPSKTNKPVPCHQQNLQIQAAEMRRKKEKKPEMKERDEREKKKKATTVAISLCSARNRCSLAAVLISPASPIT
jgi:hypothetical protein